MFEQLYYRNSTGENPIIFRTYRIFCRSYIFKNFIAPVNKRILVEFRHHLRHFCRNFFTEVYTILYKSIQLVRELFDLTMSLGP